MGLKTGYGPAAAALATGLILSWTGNGLGQAFTNLHSFALADGGEPSAGLVLSSNTLYGATQDYGGATGDGFGSVFALAIDGSSFTNLHTLSGGSDGGDVAGSLVMANGILYGTAVLGGLSDRGCVFAIGSDGATPTNLYNFSALPGLPPYTNADGAFPQTALVLAGNILFGTANGGGLLGWGVIYSVNPDGSGYTNRHSFGFIDGQYPNALTAGGDVLYGSTVGGGLSGFGTVFKVNLDGTGFTNLYSFSPLDLLTQTNQDGAYPVGCLATSEGVLYGTTSSGGAGGNGTVFRVNTDGSGFAVLHWFSATNALIGINSDGAYPQAGLILCNQTLYGTAEYGGRFGSGTVFSVNTNGSAFETLYNFTPTNSAAGTNADGAYPLSGLLMSGGVLYGTASAGGDWGYGTVYSLLAPPTLSLTLAGTNVVLTWPTNFPGYSLQCTTNCTAPFWNGLPGQYAVTNPVAGNEMFYRLNRN